MSYRCSRARREFGAQLEIAMRELAPLYKFAHKYGGSSRLLGAYYVVAYSQLEIYIKSFVEDAIGALNASGVTLDGLPDLMVGYLLHRSENLAEGYRRYGYDQDEGLVLAKIAKTARKVASWGAGAVGVGIVDAAFFLEKKKYPSPKNLPQLFRRLGVENIWAMVGSTGKMDGEKILVSLNDLRTGIAHGGNVPAGFSMSDFKDRLNQMRRFVAAIDRGISSHFCSKSISRANWNGAMT